MTASSRDLVELVLLGPTGDRRQLQDSPVLGDVWIAFATEPAAPMDLLITPHKNQSAGKVASLIAKRIRQLRGPKGEEAHIAYLQGLVAARLCFHEVVSVIVPMTQWWRGRKVQDALADYREEDKTAIIKEIIGWSRAKDKAAQSNLAKGLAKFSALDRYITLAAIILWAAAQRPAKRATDSGIVGRIAKIRNPDDIFKELKKLDDRVLSKLGSTEAPKQSHVWQISLNRKAMQALVKSVPAVKGDAVRTLFDVRCDKITWAVLDSGIDANHPAFRGVDGRPRVIGAFDFSNIRKIISFDNLNTDTPAFKRRLAELREGRENKLSAKEAAAILKRLAVDADEDRQIHWEFVERFISIDPCTPVRSAHGTHVAGIIGANAEAEQVFGMCPDINLYDFRVLGHSDEDTEFPIVAALQFLRYLNERHNYITIHGANLSLSIKHDVRNYACGRTPICDECVRLVENGVVVVAAAGNFGYHRFETKDGSFEGYAAFSITDPGNADDIITVGATHRDRPHTYGVSFFSSRGPTGDGRMKPDLVAPGERIRSCLPENGWGELDGTSMAAPHVSGAAAMLMARYPELIGEPRRIKHILCESATDLGRERSFQGHGMLDVLRAFQKI